MQKIALVVTSISKPNEVLKSLAQGCAGHDWDFTLVGDAKSPPEFKLDSCNYYGIEDQLGTGFLTADKCLRNHYARKNIGYLIAIKKGAGIIVETDDDNLPQPGFWLKRDKTKEARFIDEQGWVNVYRYFSDKNIWPRGLPLNRIHHQVQQNPADLKFKQIECPIQQGLADNNPDVDAIYRLVMPLPVQFEAAADIALAPGVWSPFNSQNTTWWEEAFPLLYLPSYCSFRMTDIWRSLIAQKIAWANQWSVLFHAPTVCQERNEHNLMKDFADEVTGYLQVETIQHILSGITITPGAQHIPDAMRLCYSHLIDAKIFDPKEKDILDAWLNDLKNLT